MADFDFAFAFMGPHEWNQKNNFTNDPADPGGSTMFGITQRTLNSYREAHPDFPASVQDLTQALAEELYRDEYWRFDGITDDRVAAKVFDIAVNMGPGEAVKGLQASLDSLGYSLAVDGRLGPLTLAQANACDPSALLNELCFYQRSHYLNWIAQDPARQKFQKGLLARAADTPEAS